jgi:hypothetical protein
VVLGRQLLELVQFDRGLVRSFVSCERETRELLALLVIVRRVRTLGDVRRVWCSCDNSQVGEIMGCETIRTPGPWKGDRTRRGVDKQPFSYSLA